MIDAYKFGNSNDINLVFSEGEKLKFLNHKNIIKIHSFFSFNNMKIAIIMDYLEGGELKNYLQSVKIK